MKTTYYGIFGHHGCAEGLRHLPPIGAEWPEAAERIRRAVRSAASLSGDRASVYAIHNDLPPMAAQRFTSVAGQTVKERLVPLAVVGHTPSLATVQSLANRLAVKLGSIRQEMGFGAAKQLAMASASLEDLTLGTTFQWEGFRAWSITSGKALPATVSMESLASVSKLVSQRYESLLCSGKNTQSMRARLCWSGGEPNANSSRYGNLMVDLVEAPPWLSSVTNALWAAIDAAFNEELEFFELYDACDLRPVFQAGFLARPFFESGDASVAAVCASVEEAESWLRAHSGAAVEGWIACDKHGVAAWRRPDLVDGAMEKIGHAIRGLERIAGRRGAVSHLPYLPAALDALRANSNFARSP